MYSLYQYKVQILTQRLVQKEVELAGGGIEAMQARVDEATQLLSESESEKGKITKELATAHSEIHRLLVRNFVFSRIFFVIWTAFIWCVWVCPPPVGSDPTPTHVEVLDLVRISAGASQRPGSATDALGGGSG
jgi:hypothetical protein